MSGEFFYRLMEEFLYRLLGMIFSHAL